MLKGILPPLILYSISQFLYFSFPSPQSIFLFLLAAVLSPQHTTLPSLGRCFSFSPPTLFSSSNASTQCTFALRGNCPKRNPTKTLPEWDWEGRWVFLRWLDWLGYLEFQWWMTLSWPSSTSLQSWTVYKVWPFSFFNSGSIQKFEVNGLIQFLSERILCHGNGARTLMTSLLGRRQLKVFQPLKVKNRLVQTRPAHRVERRSIFLRIPACSRRAGETLLSRWKPSALEHCMELAGVMLMALSVSAPASKTKRLMMGQGENSSIFSAPFTMLNSETRWSNLGRAVTHNRRSDID